MPNIYTPCTWNMGAAQLVTPTSSQLAAVNAIQAAVTASTYWTVNSTGTTTAGYKYVEARLTNTSSVYKDYRILFVERVNSATGKQYTNANPFNTTTNVMVYFAPDGGSSWCTFTPANIETASSPYVGTRYKAGTSTATVHWWANIAGPWTAIWMYECDGAMWLVNRAGTTSHYLMGIGNIYVPGRSTHVDYNESGTEVGLAAIWQNASAWSASTITGPTIMGNSMPMIWYQTAPGAKSAMQGSGLSAAQRAPSFSGSAASLNGFYSSAGGAAFLPFFWYLEVSTSANSGNGTFVNRGMYFAGNMQTRTTIQSGSPASTIGYTFFPDDASNGSANNAYPLAFMNTP
jgi:hypothetical protein